MDGIEAFRQTVGSKGNLYVWMCIKKISLKLAISDAPLVLYKHAFDISHIFIAIETPP
jgi:hypothetical protein